MAKQGSAPGSAKSGASYSKVMGSHAQGVRSAGGMTKPKSTGGGHSPKGSTNAGNGSAQLDFRSGSKVPSVPGMKKTGGSGSYPGRNVGKGLPNLKGGADC